MRDHTYNFIFSKVNRLQGPKLMRGGFVNLTTVDRFTVGKIPVSRTGAGNLLREVSSGDEIIGHR